MSERDLLAQTVDSLLSDRCTYEVVAHACDAPTEAGFASELWDLLEDGGLTLVSIPEAAGGSGGTLADAAVILRSVGRHSAPVPLAETALLAGWALAAARFPIPAGPLALVLGPPTFQPSGSGWVVSGEVPRVPWASIAEHLVVVGVDASGQVMVALVQPADSDPTRCAIRAGRNMAGEPRDDVLFNNLHVAAEHVATGAADLPSQLSLRATFARSVLLGGALGRVLELSVTHAREREQFGRPIGKFQAVQQQLAQLAGEVAAAGAAIAVAVEAADAAEVAGQSLSMQEIAIAKIRSGEAAGTVAAIAHQVHGAIGFTQEHSLHHATRRLWSWRDEDGTESEWAITLGTSIASAGPEAFWPTITL